MDKARPLAAAHYAATSWARVRRGVARIEVTRKGVDTRYVITDPTQRHPCRFTAETRQQSGCHFNLAVTIQPPTFATPARPLSPRPAAGNHGSPGPAVWQAGAPLARPDQRIQTGT